MDLYDFKVRVCKHCGVRSHKNCWCPSERRNRYNRGKRKRTMRDHRLGVSDLKQRKGGKAKKNAHWRVNSFHPPWKWDLEPRPYPRVSARSLFWDRYWAKKGRCRYPYSCTCKWCIEKSKPMQKEIKHRHNGGVKWHNDRCNQYARWTGTCIC